MLKLEAGRYQLQTRRYKHRRTDIRRCALIAALVSAALVGGVELAGSSLAGAYSGLGRTLQPAPQGEATATAPASAPR